DGADDRRRLPGGGRGGREVAPRAAHLDPALHVLRRVHGDVGDRRGAAGRYLHAGVARRDARARLAAAPTPAHAARRLNVHRPETGPTSTWLPGDGRPHLTLGCPTRRSERRWHTRSGGWPPPGWR